MFIFIGFFFMVMFVFELVVVIKVWGVVVKFFVIIDCVFIIDFVSDEGLKFDSFYGEISFENVKFYYLFWFSVFILKGFIIIFEVGKIFVFVGVSGSGKSIVVFFIERFYDFISGVVKFDGKDIRLFNFNWFC